MKWEEIDQTMKDRGTTVAVDGFFFKNLPDGKIHVTDGTIESTHRNLLLAVRAKGIRKDAFERALNQPAVAVTPAVEPTRPQPSIPTVMSDTPASAAAPEAPASYKTVKPLSEREQGLNAVHSAVIKEVPDKAMRATLNGPIRALVSALGTSDDLATRAPGKPVVGLSEASRAGITEKAVEAVKAALASPDPKGTLDQTVNTLKDQNKALNIEQMRTTKKPEKAQTVGQDV